ncbi:MAG: hypothetical protein RIE08_00995 [Acidimicrobiales bacterium]
MPSAAAVSGTHPDPHGIGSAVARLSMLTRRAGRTAFAVVAGELAEGEMVEVAVQCRYLGHGGVAVLVADRIVFANDREWEPEVMAMPIDATTTVTGWQDERSAALVIATGDVTVTIDQIRDRELAQALAATVRAKAASAGQ